jgi:membrane protease YdiL (CAAX protease family)
MNDQPVASAEASKATWIGLFISLFAMLIVRQTVSYFWPSLTFTSALAREAGIWLSALAVYVVIRRGEGLSLRSVGLGTSPWWKSILWGLIITLASLLAAVMLAHLTGYGHGPGSAAMDKLPLWLVTLIVTRAGVVEEFFYRGYAIERLQALGLSRAWASLIPLVIFSIGHWTGGAANILMALIIGLILTVFYLWRGDLIANIIGHFMVDFIGNVLPRLIP